MRATLKRRLDRLERRIPEPALPPTESAIPKIREWLAAWGVVQEGNESLAETTARGMGITPMELRKKLLIRASGGTW